VTLELQEARKELENNVGITAVEFARKRLRIKLTDYNIASFKDILARLPRGNKGKAGNIMCLESFEFIGTVSRAV
jgi:hypothetical protein